MIHGQHTQKLFVLCVIKSFKMSLIPIKSEKSERDRLVNHVFYPFCVQGWLRQALQSTGAEVFVLGIVPSQQGVKELNMESRGERNP